MALHVLRGQCYCNCYGTSESWNIGKVAFTSKW